MITFFVLFPRTKNFLSNNNQLKYNTCIVEYKYYWLGEQYLWEGHTIPNEMFFYSANRSLAICLCDEYLKTKNTVLSTKIIELTVLYGDRYEFNSTIDSVVYHRNKILDPILHIE